MNVRAALRPHKAAPICSAPAPTSVGDMDRGYFLHAEKQRLIEDALVGYVGAGRRALQVTDDEERAAACWTLCSKAGYTTPPFFFSLQANGEGACYCSTKGRCV